MHRRGIRGVFGGTEKDSQWGQFLDGQVARYNASTNTMEGTTISATGGGAQRLEFTLRTTSVAGTDYEEIGVLRLDATPMGGALTVVAELEVSASGQSVDCQLYNLTAAAPVVTLTGASMVTTKVTAAVMLALSEQLYAVRLRRVGGSPGQQVSCRSIYLAT